MKIFYQMGLCLDSSQIYVIFNGLYNPIPPRQPTQAAYFPSEAVCTSGDLPFWRTLFSLVTFKKKFLLALVEALQLWPAIRACRRADKKYWVLRDRDILAKPLETLKNLGEH